MVRIIDRRYRFLSSVLVVSALAGCGGGSSSDSVEPRSTNSQTPTPSPTSQGDPTASAGTPPGLDEIVNVAGDRGLYVRCSGRGSPTLVLEGGDGDTADSYAFAESTLAKLTRTCVYDRANLGSSDPAKGPRQLLDLVGDLESLLERGEIPGPYVLVGTSGGGYITAGFAAANPDDVAGMVFIDTASPFRNPPREIVEATAPDSAENVERRDYLQVEKDAWATRRQVGNIPVTVVTVKFSAAAINESPFPAEREAMARNVQRQRGWLVLSPRARQIVVRTGHAVEEEQPDLVIDVIRDVVQAAR